MKSLNYTLFHSTPKNFDDCIDYASEKRQHGIGTTVSLDVRMDFEVCEGYILRTVAGHYIWVFSDGVRAEFDRVFGGFLEGDGERTRDRSVTAADTHINTDLARLTRLGVPVEIRRHFGVSPAFQPW